jgi:hypothetical protein
MDAGVRWVPRDLPGSPGWPWSGGGCHRHRDELDERGVINSAGAGGGSAAGGPLLVVDGQVRFVLDRTWRASSRQRTSSIPTSRADGIRVLRWR